MRTVFPFSLQESKKKDLFPQKYPYIYETALRTPWDYLRTTETPNHLCLGVKKMGGGIFLLKSNENDTFFRILFGHIKTFY